MAEKSKRALTEGEKRILSLIQKLYGKQNTEDECFIEEMHGGAVIFVKSSDGSIPICVNLSVVYSVSKSDELSDQEIIEQWLTKLEPDNK